MTQPSHLVSLRAAPRAASEGKPPMLILLHGYGADEHDLLPLAQHLDPHFVVRSVQGPVALPTGGRAWFPFSALSDGARRVDGTQAEASRQALLRFIPEAIAAENADPERVYLAGFSQGGIMALAIGLTEPAKVAGVVAMSSRLLPEFDSIRASNEALTGLPVLVVHGTMDQMLPIPNGRATQAQLSKLPLAFTYQEFPMRHEITAASLGLVSAWLAERLTQPRRLPLSPASP
jgi:phospholipase/carboxylesterase